MHSSEEAVLERLTKVPKTKRTLKKWIRNESDRYAISQGCYFDEAAGERVCKFVETFCRQSQGRQWNGKLIVLMPWQRDWLMRLFGWKRKNGTRRYRRAYLEIPKKNGKSTLISAVVLYLLVADHEGGPKVFINACDREQAKIVYNEAVLMVEASPALSARLSVNRSNHTISFRANNGSLRANSADAPSKDGANASAWVFDEIHRQPSRVMYDIFRYAGDARDQPLEIDITTAGDDMTGVWYDLREYSEKVNSGTEPDISHFGTVYAATEDDDITDPKVWARVNPSLGTILKLEDFAAAFAEAKQTPEKFANFKRLKLGLVTTSESKAFNLADWKACSGPLRDLKGRPGYGGYDLSSINDLTAWVMVFPDEEDDTLDVLFRCWMPGENVAARERGHRVKYREWERLGDIKFSNSFSVDYAAVEKQIIADCQEYDIQLILADPWNADRVTNNLIDEGIKVEYLQQRWSLNAPTKELQRLILEKKLRHGGHRVATWCASNAVASTDANNNVMLNKKKSREKIDLMSALVNAIAACMSAPRTPRSIYEYGVYSA